MSSSIILRPWSVDDIASLTWLANNWMISRYLRDQYPHPYSENDAKQFIQIIIKQQPCTTFAITIPSTSASTSTSTSSTSTPTSPSTSTSTLIGGISLTIGSAETRGTAELGIWLGMPYWGKGYGLQAIQHILILAWETYHLIRVYAHVVCENIPCQRMLEKCGFICEGVQRCGMIKDGIMYDIKLYAMVNPSNLSRITPSPPRPYRIIPNIPYITSPTDIQHQSYDLYMPTSSSSSSSSSTSHPPLLIFIHGGLWVSRDKSQYTNIGLTYTSHGMYVANINYRLSGTEDKHLHPTHMYDVYAAIKHLTHPDVAGAYGYDIDHVYIMGHSCGGTMAGLFHGNSKAYDYHTITTCTPFTTKSSSSLSKSASTSTTASASSPSTTSSTSVPTSSLSPSPSPSPSIRGYIGIDGMYDLSSWAHDFPEWRSELTQSQGDDEMKWDSPILYIPSNIPWLILHSKDDAWVNEQQAIIWETHLQQYITHLDMDINLRGEHFAIMNEIGSENDVITSRILTFIQNIQ